MIMEANELFVTIFNEGLNSSEMNAVRGGTAHPLCTCDGGGSTYDCGCYTHCTCNAGATLLCSCNSVKATEPVDPVCPCLKSYRQ